MQIPDHKGYRGLCHQWRLRKERREGAVLIQGYTCDCGAVRVDVDAREAYRIPETTDCPVAKAGAEIVDLFGGAAEVRFYRHVA